MMKRAQKEPLNTTKIRICDNEGCCEEGLFRAPKYKRVVDRPLRDEDCLFLCKDHIREYNKGWNFFSGMSDEEANTFQRDAITGHRPTRLPDYHGYKTLLHWHDAIDHFTENFHYISPQEEQEKLPHKIKNALVVLGLSYPLHMHELKKRYKTLVKEHHPDVNRGDKACEERFKRINDAYHTLKDCDYVVA